MNEYIGYVVTGVLVLLIGGLIVGTLLDEVPKYKRDTAYKNGQMSLEDYCNASTDNGTNTSHIPVACYRYFGAQRVGTDCHFVGKVMTCEPVLAPAPIDTLSWATSTNTH